MSREACIELAKRFGINANDVIERWLERTAIRECEGEQRREQAERDAFDDI